MNKISRLKQRSDIFKKTYCTFKDFLIHPGSKCSCSLVLGSHLGL